MFVDEGEAKRCATERAGNNPGATVYAVYEWRNGERWQDHPTGYEKRGFVVVEPDLEAERRRAAALKAAADIAWGQWDSERGHANMQTAHNQLKNWK